MVSKSPLQRLSLWGPPVAYMALIFHFSSESNPLPELTAHVWDKLLHVTEYAGLALLFCRALHREEIGWLPAILVAILLTSMYGISDEWHQRYVPMRSTDLKDWLADTTGGAMGAVCYSIALARWSRQRAGSA